MTSSLHRLLTEGVIRYSQVWEDHALVEDGLALGPGDDVLSIGSAGCNVLGALLREPRSVLAIDLNPAQAALIALKLRAIEALEWDEFVRFLGLAPGSDRVALYERLRTRLGERERAYWDANEAVLAAGVHWSGRLEQFFRGFAVDVLPTVHSVDVVDRLLAMDDLGAQTRFFDETFGTEALHAAFTSYFTRERLASEGRDPRQMRYVAAMDVAGFFWGRFRWVLTSLPARGNFYLHSFLTGRYRDLEAMPPYLRRENYARLRSLLPRVSITVSDVETVLKERPVGTFSKTNLSDLFEYLSDEATESLFATIGERLRKGGRACFWNLLVPRSPGDAAARARLRPMPGLASNLHARDRSWFYRAFHVEEVVSG